MAIVKIKIYGFVQGVTFRKSAQRKARELEISGWVKNEIDGSVISEAEGDRKKLEEFISWCKNGSEWASVSNVDYEFLGDTKKFKDFIIKL